MKPNLSYSLLLFLLLIGKSLSASLRPSTKPIFKNINAKQQFPPSQQNESPNQIMEDLHAYKQYLYNIGYLQNSTEPFNDYLDEETITAITTYQKYFNLQPTGNLNQETLRQMWVPRCGNPDMNFDYGFGDGNMSFPKAGNRWFPEGDLFYGMNFGGPYDLRTVVKNAFARWAMATGGLRLSETTYDNADIKIEFKWVGVDDSVLKMFYSGSVLILRRGSNITEGNIHLDRAKSWDFSGKMEMLSWVEGVVDVETAVMHQIGHILGLDHSNDQDSVMYPYILPSRQRKVELSDSDRDNIRRRYDNNGSYGHGGRWGVLLVTTLSLGFAYVMFLLY